MNFVPPNRDVPHSTAEVCLNLWYFVDAMGVVVRVAGKAYTLTGSDEQKLAILELLAGTDHLTATQGRVPANLGVVFENGELEGAVPFSAIPECHNDVFDSLIDDLERTLPKCSRSVEGNLEQFVMTIPRKPLCVTTGVLERADGELVAQVAEHS